MREVHAHEESSTLLTFRIDVGVLIEGVHESHSRACEFQLLVDPEVFLDFDASENIIDIVVLIQAFIITPPDTVLELVASRSHGLTLS